jgi:hypothetical protein
MLAPKRALRVAPGGCAPLLPCVARRGPGVVRPGRESGRVNRTGKLLLAGGGLDHGLPFSSWKRIRSKLEAIWRMWDEIDPSYRVRGDLE